MCKIAYNSLNIDHIHSKFAFRPPICVPNFSHVDAHMWKEEKMKKFFKSLIARISGMAYGLFFKFGMWPPLSGGHLHCKFGAIRIRHYRAIYALKLRLCFSCQHTHSVYACPLFLGRMTDTLITPACYLMHTDKCIMYSYIFILQCSEEVFQCHYTSFQFARAKVKMFYMGTAPKI